jgi:site-specific recombinase XerD
MMNTFKELTDYYNYIDNNHSKNSRRSYHAAIDGFVSHFGITSTMDIESLTSEDIHTWLVYLKDNMNSKNEDTAKASANAKFRIIKAFCNWLVENSYLSDSPCNTVRRFKEAKKVRAYLTKQERDAIILSTKNIKDRLVMAIMAYTGLRVGEVVKIKLSDIQSNYLIVNGKGNKQRRLALNSYVMGLLDEYLETREDNNDYLFVSKKGFGDTAGVTHSVSKQAIRDIVKKSAINANIDPKKLDKISCHTLRRTFAVRLVEDQRASMFQVQKALGHSSVLTSQRYVDSAGAEISDSVLLEQEAPQMERSV